MSRRIVDFDEPDHFMVLVIDEPGERRLLLQAAQDGRVTSVALEPELLDMLLERTWAVIDELERRGLAAIDVASPAASQRDLQAQTDASTLEEFRAGSLSIVFDEDVDRLIIEMRAQLADGGAGESASPPLEDVEDEIPDDAPIGPDVLRVHLRLTMVQRFLRQAARAIGRAQPSCPLCGEPLDVNGHHCPPEDERA